MATNSYFGESRRRHSSIDERHIVKKNTIVQYIFPSISCAKTNGDNDFFLTFRPSTI